jgi:hypothetical protein
MDVNSTRVPNTDSSTMTIVDAAIRAVLVRRSIIVFLSRR